MREMGMELRGAGRHFLIISAANPLSFFGYMVAEPFGYDEAAFSRDVIARWADICDALIDDEGLLHQQMGHIGRLCKAHPEIAPEVFQFLEALLARNDAISEIKNAVAISFLGWEDVRRLGFSERLPTKVAEIIKEQWKRYQQGP
jgi:hypothetical protein